jgi:hypothetical protein
MLFGLWTGAHKSESKSTETVLVGLCVCINIGINHMKKHVSESEKKDSSPHNSYTFELYSTSNRTYVLTLFKGITIN